LLAGKIHKGRSSLLLIKVSVSGGHNSLVGQGRVCCSNCPPSENLESQFQKKKHKKKKKNKKLVPKKKARNEVLAKLRRSGMKGGGGIWGH